MIQTDDVHKILTILPAYNVANIIGRVLEEMGDILDNVLVIDDGSSDNTYEVLRGYKVKTIRHTKNLGVSFSIREGIEYALHNGYHYVITMDSDGQHDPIFLDEFIEKLYSCELVCGNRFNSFGGIPISKLSSNTFASSVLLSLFNTYIPDACCGFKGFRINKDLLDYLDKSTDYSIVYDILLYAIKNGLKIDFVNMQAIYFSTEMWITRLKEIESFFQAINRTKANNSTLLYIIENCNQHNNFTVSVSSVEYSFFYLNDYGSYIIQADYNSIINYHKDLRKQPDVIKYYNSSL